jgi:ABC-type multidrug transport system fused ATPase/permease subunit
MGSIYFQISFVLLAILLTTPFAIIAIFPLALVYFLIQRYSSPMPRQMRRMDAVTRSPMFAQYSETINGLATIKAFRRQEAFVTGVRVT